LRLELKGYFIFHGLNSSCSYHDKSNAIYFNHKKCTLFSSLEILICQLKHRIDELLICILVHVQFAAFELSTLVGLTERWLIYIPFVVLPMAW
jgi:hypothetical protein